MTAGTYNSGSLREPNRVRAGRVTHRIQRKHDLVARRRRGSDDLGQRTDASAHTDGAARRAYLVVVTFVHVYGEARFCRVPRVEEATRTTAFVLLRRATNTGVSTSSTHSTDARNVSRPRT